MCDNFNYVDVFHNNLEYMISSHRYSSNLHFADCYLSFELKKNNFKKKNVSFIKLYIHFKFLQSTLKYPI